MSYRRDVRYDPNNGARIDIEQIPLPIEMVYNSFTDAITDTDPTTGDESYFQNGPKHFNRIYFKYPPEWKTSNIGEKIIGVRNMKISIRKCTQLDFVLYIRKYKQDKFDDLANGLYPDDDLSHLNDDQIQDVVNRMDPKDIQVYRIEYVNDIYDDVDDFIDNLYDEINDNNVYNMLRDRILDSGQSKDEKIAALEQLDSDKDNYHLMCLRNDVPFYLNNDVDGIYDVRDFTIVEEIGDKIMLSFRSNQNDHDEFYVDFMMTPNNDDATYKKFYQWDDGNDEPLPYAAVYPDELDENDRFEFDTANYFNIGTTNPNRNSLEYVTKFHRDLIFNNVMTSLEREVAASFASQSNHNIIGRTNEIFNPIKYFKINDDDDKFWIEFYDRNEIDVPVSFNDFVMFTMDVVFLQNRKLLYN
ncbi:hypothetical protein M9Y10_035259 [Tritrichomonas musculus]|uniref:Uncharacterized protein n=1 Tax=Tritrichomonas musculus TaxID=1915356 RepID=A0ABR2KH63_9EUKA